MGTDATSNEYFFIFYKSFLFCTSIVNKKTGEEIRATDTMCNIYIYMLDQYLSYKKLGKTFYENQLDICKKLRKMDPKTFRSNYEKLRALDLVSHVEHQSCGRYKSYEYTVTTPEEAEGWLQFKYGFDTSKEQKPESPTIQHSVVSDDDGDIPSFSK
ncbi:MULTISPECIES: DUF6945 domain-containing protein [Klebsiella pneumoniae complex]|uniref:DUF6945 domain-containing protein n=1 Tax=Klebsiella pneumoniae complex TaxID=3390273 RepID=UPI0011592162|nr:MULTISPECIES: hypothetical protein [Klebsiella]MBD7727368.1 hypothetical protein [Klebsiella pneumoniae]MDZ2605722.1 hypothetical protein [Klebsiella variicola]MED6038413.1 hypothetical protein [Klebsiella pneumoniae]HBV6577204.1 hypothetical protein [Klebsiella pneumoniae]HBX7738142.1 hypothetical protein [Klebsiella pneumoniae]